MNESSLPEYLSNRIYAVQVHHEFGSFVTAAFTTIEKAWTYMDDIVNCTIAEVLMHDKDAIIKCSILNDSLELIINDSKHIVHEIVTLILE